MENNNQKQRPWFFSLNADGDSAVVRLLHTTTATIEKVTSHRVQIAEKYKRVKCIGDGCPLCEKSQADERIYVHLYDYTDNKEKVWERTDKILPQLDKLLESWNPLNSAVVKIVRKGDAFPKYEITPLNPMSYADVDKSLIDEKVAKRYSMNRTKEEIATFVQTGSFPERPQYVPKDQYFKNKKTDKPTETKVATNDTPQSFEPINDDVFDPFVDNVGSKPRKV